MKRSAVLVMVLLLGVAAGAGGALFLRGGSGGTSQPSKTPDIAKVGDTPPSGRRRIVYQSTMNPSEIADSPGKDSMGMEMVPVELDEPTSSPGLGVKGRSTINVNDRKRQLIGVRTVPVEKKPLVRSIRTVGLIAYDETRLHQVTTKVGGWIEKLYANSTGEPIRKGQPMLTIYSPELLASSQEYLLALRARDRLAASGMVSVRDSSEALVQSAKRRLALYDLSARQIADLESTGEAPRVMTLYAPITGHIITRKVTQGERIEPGANLFEIADLENIWVMAEVYEYELPFVKAGQKAFMTLPYLPGQTFEGRVELIYPVLSEATRTVKLRLRFPNPELSLKPEMYASVRIESDRGTGIVIPDSAVISSGARDIVFVDRGEGNLEPREIKLGLRLPDGVEVLEGLEAGENVVVSGNFLIDSESQLKAALGASALGKGASPDRKAAPGHVH